MSDETQVKNTASVSVMNQLPVKGDDVTLAQSPLFDSKINSSVQQNSTSENNVKLDELSLLGHLVIRCNAEDKKLGLAIENVLGVALPSTLQSVRIEEISIYWLSPDEWLVICPGEKTYDLEQSLQNSVSSHCAVINASGGQTVLTMSGDGARTVLMKSTPYDVSDQNFPIGKVVTSTFGKSQAIICRKNDTEWELIIRRSFAAYIFLWLQKAIKNTN